MPLLVWVTFAVAVLTTVGALVWTVRTLVAGLRRLGRELEELQRDLGPALRRLEDGSRVTSTELAALGERSEALSHAATERPERRWRPRGRQRGRPARG